MNFFGPSRRRYFSRLESKTKRNFSQGSGRESRFLKVPPKDSSFDGIYGRPVAALECERAEKTPVIDSPVGFLLR